MEIQKKKKLITFISIGVGAALLIVFIFILIFVIIPAAQSNDNNNGGNDVKTFYITSLEVQIGGITQTDITREFGSNDVQLTVRINNNTDISNYDTPAIKWTLIESCLNSEISEDGILSAGNVLGSAAIKVEVMSQNLLDTIVPLHIVSKYGSVLQGIRIEEFPNNLTYIEGQYFNCDGLLLFAEYSYASGDYEVRVTNYTINPNLKLTHESLNGLMQVEVIFADKSLSFSQPINIILVSRSLQSISIIESPNVNFIEGQPLALDGLRVASNYEYLSHELLDWFTNISIGSPLSYGITYIQIRYFTRNTLFETKLPISVARRTLQAISVTGTRTHYIRHQRFDTSNLQVIAFFEYLKLDVTNQIDLSNSNQLMLADSGTEIVISFTENGITATHSIPITVGLPYDERTWLTINGDPQNVAVSWIFTYPSDYGEETIDYQTWQEQGLVFDPINGIFEIPVGAVVTVRKVNPMILDFFINDLAFGLEHMENSFDFVVGLFDIEISYELVIGDRIVLRFENPANYNVLMFYFSANWNGYLRDLHLERIAFFFNENENFFYQFTIDGEEYLFDELEEFNFRLLAFYGDEFITILISVLRVEALPPVTRIITLVLWDGEEMVRTILADLPVEQQIQEPVKNGYWFVRWIEYGVNIYLAEWISMFGEVDYEDEHFIGTWTYNLNDVLINLTFNEDGYFTYSAGDFELYGKFRLVDDKIVIKTVNTTGSHLPIYLDDFCFEFSNNTLRANVFVIEFEQVGYDTLLLLTQETVYMTQ